VRGVGELAELGREQVRRLLADVDGMVADPLERPRHDHHAQAVLTHLRVLSQLEDALHDSAICAEKIWGRRETHRDRTVDVFVRRLRDKIDRRSTRHTFIQTRYGVGYRLEPLTKD
jgi:DNA-binding response OmpR family regulator